MKIKKGDNIVVIAGKDRGKTGKVLTAFPKTNMILVEGVNIKKKHRRPTRANQHGQVVEKSAPVHVSNVMVTDPKGGKPTRVRYEMKNGSKVRVAVKSGAALA